MDTTEEFVCVGRLIGFEFVSAYIFFMFCLLLSFSSSIISFPSTYSHFSRQFLLDFLNAPHFLHSFTFYMFDRLRSNDRTLRNCCKIAFKHFTCNDFQCTFHCDLIALNEAIRISKNCPQKCVFLVPGCRELSILV